ncbi:MAG: hypothetical protein AAFR13_07385 [Pseudomonadota bacterium]
MPKLVRFVVVNSLIGVLIGWAIAAAMLYTDVGGIGGLFLRSTAKMEILILLAVSSGVTFGFAYLTTAVLLMPTDKEKFDKL